MIKKNVYCNVEVYMERSLRAYTNLNVEMKSFFVFPPKNSISKQTKKTQKSKFEVMNGQIAKKRHNLLKR